MVKVWKDIDEVIASTQLPDDLKGYKECMEEVPRHNKHNVDNNRVVYRRKEFIIITTSGGFIVINKDKGFDRGHTHANNFSFAKSLIDLSVRKRVPNKPNKYLIESLKRINKDNKYINKLEGVIKHERC